MTTALAAIAAAPGAGDPLAKARKQAEELEGVFLNTLMKEMFSSLNTEATEFGGGFAEETWRGLQAEQFAASMAEAGGIGLADAIVADLLQMQEASTSTTNSFRGAYR